jgi:hypothetical protein
MTRSLEISLLLLVLGTAAGVVSASAEPSGGYERPPSLYREGTHVFQRAFWRRAVEEDRILHAERREWHNDEGHVEKWEWFIAVRPGANFETHLRKDNPFNLVARPTASLPEGAPDWFPREVDGFLVQQNAAGTMIFLWRQADGLLFATDSGGGFRPGAAPPAQPPAAGPTLPMTGRLPPVPPPVPAGR